MAETQKVIEALRAPKKEKSKPVLPTKARGYQLHVQEAEVMGEKPKSYEEWMKENASQ